MAYLNSRPRTPEVCPVCGENVPPRALACPECGADHNSGWRLDAEVVEQDFGDDEFDYDEFLKREFGSRPQVVPSGIKPIWWITAVIVLVALIAGYFVSVLR